MGLVVAVGLVGCKPKIKAEEFGTPVYEESKLPGAGDPPFPLKREPPAES